MRFLLHGYRPVISRVQPRPSRWLRSPVQPHLGRRFSTHAPLWTTPTPSIQLRPYQEESIQAVLKYLEAGEKRLGISLATGSGKTVIFSHLIERVPSPTPEATQTLILAHRQELVSQAAEHCRRLYPESTVDVDMGRVHASGVADITVASVQSLANGERLMRYDPKRFKLLLVDEAHHVVAPIYLKVLEHFGLMAEDPGERGATALVGVTATFSRADGMSLGAAIDHIVYHKDYVDMIDEKWLANVRFTTVESRADLSKVKTAMGDFQIRALSKAVNTPETNDVIVRSWMEMAKERKSTLVFCVDLDHVDALTAMFRANGIDARFVTSETAPKVRVERLAAFKDGQYPVLVNCGIFTEGTDIPNIDCIILGRPTKSRNLLIQMVGRGLRTSPGKEDCHVIDMVASLAKGIVTTPTLFGLNPNEAVKDASAQDLKEKKRQEDEENQWAEQGRYARPGAFKGELTFTHFDSVNALLANTSGERHIRGISRLAWVQVDDSRFVLSDTSGSYLTIQHRKDDFLVLFTQKFSKTVKETMKEDTSPFMRPYSIAKSSTFEHAINAADTFAKARFVVPMVTTSAPWRRTPATPQQLMLLNKFRDADDQLQASSINKGSAADWITKLKHGARGRFKKMQAEKARVDKLRRAADREVVRAGPVAGRRLVDGVSDSI